MSHTHLTTLTAGKYFTYYVSVSFPTFGLEPKLPFFLRFVTKSRVFYLKIKSEKGIFLLVIVVLPERVSVF